MTPACWPLPGSVPRGRCPVACSEQTVSEDDTFKKESSIPAKDKCLGVRGAGPFPGAGPASLPQCWVGLCWEHRVGSLGTPAPGEGQGLPEWPGHI